MNQPLVPRFIALLSIIFAVSVSLPAERLPLRIYTSAEGLGTSAAFGLVRDYRGFIWLCSRDGLIRFDGNRFITYHIGNEGDDPAVNRLLPTRNGVYWIDLNRGTDYRFVDRGESVLLSPIQQQLSQNDPRVPLVNIEPTGNLRMPAFEDASGNLWSYEGRGLDLLHERDGRTVIELIEISQSAGSVGLSAANFRSSNDGGFWVRTNLGLLRRLPDGRIIRFMLDGENRTTAFLSFVEDKEHRLWIARPEGLLVLKVAPADELSALANLSERKIVVANGRVDGDGNAQLPERPDQAFLFAFSNLLHRQTPTRGQSRTRPAIFDLLCASDGKIYIATTNALLVFNGQRFQQFTTEQGLASSFVNTMAEDNEGQIWLDSYGGLMRLNPKGLTSFDQQDGLADSTVISIYESRDGVLNVVSTDWSIASLRNGVFVSGRPQLPENVARGWLSNPAFLDSRGDWWVVTSEKLYRYSGINHPEELAHRQPAAVYTEQNGLIANDTYHVWEDSQGDIWISNHAKQAGLVRWQRSADRFQYFLEADSFPGGGYVTSFAEDKAGNLWFGFINGAIARYRDGRFTVFDAKDGLTPGSITSLYVDKAGRLWIASSVGGLSRVDDPTAGHPGFRHYGVADGLTSNNVRCITEDLFGNIYIGTVRGINRLVPQTGSIKYYGTADGLASDFVSVAYRDRQGALWFGTYHGLSKLTPEPESPSSSPPILIDKLRIAGVDYAVSPLGQREAFAPEQTASQNNLQIDFFSISAAASTSLRYQYKLEGAGADWSAPTTTRSVTFANLSPGTYRFLVRAISLEGLTSPQPASVTFSIARPVWQRWWFLTLAALAIIGTAYLLYRYRLAQLLKVERVRTRIATDLHDDIGASLSRMAILSEVVKQQTAAGDGKQSATMLTEIADSARGLVDSMSDIVWSIDPRRDDVQSVVRRLRQFASDVLEAKGIDWHLNVPPEVESMKLNPEERQHLFLIFKEAMNNVVRHGAGAKSVSMSISIEGRQLIGEVIDDGCGFTLDERAEVQPKSRGGNGLPNMRERAKQLRGRLDISSAAGAGTKLTLKMPIR